MVTSTISLQPKVNNKKFASKKLQSPSLSRQRSFNKTATIPKSKTPTLDLEPTSLNLPELCLSIVEEIETRMQSDVAISLTLRSNSSNVCLDKNLIQPILINLLANAVKYSQGTKSKVDLEVAVKPNSVTFTVQDRGIGIPIADQARIFEAFYQGENTDKIKGSGIGLTVTKRCVDLHGGKITFESTLGEGSRFTVYIPLLR